LADFPGTLVECKSGSAAYCIGYGKEDIVKIHIHIPTKQVRTQHSEGPSVMVVRAWICEPGLSLVTANNNQNPPAAATANVPGAGVPGNAPVGPGNWGAPPPSTVNLARAPGVWGAPPSIAANYPGAATGLFNFGAQPGIGANFPPGFGHGNFGTPPGTAPNLPGAPFGRGNVRAASAAGPNYLGVPAGRGNMRAASATGANFPRIL